MNRRDFLGRVSAGALALAGCQSVPAQAKQRPNIVFFLVDDMGWADVGCFGSTFHETPNIDRFAREGLRFMQAYAACPVCSPTRASIMTGKYPARLHLTDFLKGARSPEDSPVLPAPYLDQLALEETTIPEVLREAGYATGIVGKWHLGDASYGPQKQGFDMAIGVPGGGGLRSYFWPGWSSPLEGHFRGEYLADRYTDEACAFIQAHRERPFFLYLAHNSVHIPLEAKAEKIKKYEEKLKAHPPQEGRQNNPHYAAMVESVDESLGRVLETLETCGIADNTLVVFFADNGGLSVHEGKLTPATTNYPLRAGKGYLYEGGVREPMIVRWPGVTKPNSTCDTPVCSIDFLPTFRAIAAPGVKAGPVDGLDISPLLRREQKTLDRPALYWHYPHFSNQGGRPGGAIRAGDWKLIEEYEYGKLELYNLRDDIGETKNLAEAEPKRARALHEQLVAWRAEVNATMPPPNPRYKPGAK